METQINGGVKLGIALAKTNFDFFKLQIFS